MAEPSPILQAWRAAGRYVQWRGLEVFLRTTATVTDRPGMLLIHGFPTASFDWQPMWDALASHFNLAAPDLLGLGLSAKPSRFDYTVAAQADLMESVLTQLGWPDRPVHLLAHDLGDTVAQELLARHHDGRLKLGSVVFLNGGLFPEAHRARRAQKLLATPVVGPLLARLLGRRSFRRAMRAIAGRQPPDETLLDDLWWLLSRQRGSLRLPQLLGYLAERWCCRDRWVGALARLHNRPPIRLICGLADPISGAHMADRFAQLVPAADIVRLPDVGHYPQLEAPDAVLAAVLDFHDRIQAEGRN